MGKGTPHWKNVVFQKEAANRTTFLLRMVVEEYPYLLFHTVSIHSCLPILSFFAESK